MARQLGCRAGPRMLQDQSKTGRHRRQVSRRPPCLGLARSCTVLRAAAPTTEAGRCCGVQEGSLVGRRRPAGACKTGRHRRWVSLRPPCLGLARSRTVLRAAAPARWAALAGSAQDQLLVDHDMHVLVVKMVYVWTTSPLGCAAGFWGDVNAGHLNRLSQDGGRAAYYYYPPPRRRRRSRHVSAPTLG